MLKDIYFAYMEAFISRFGINLGKEVNTCSFLTTLFVLAHKQYNLPTYGQGI